MNKRTVIPYEELFEGWMDAEMSIEDKLTMLSYQVSSDFHYQGIVRTEADKLYVELENALKELYPSKTAFKPTDEEYELLF